MLGEPLNTHLTVYPSTSAFPPLEVTVESMFVDG